MQNGPLTLARPVMKGFVCRLIPIHLPLHIRVKRFHPLCLISTCSLGTSGGGHRRELSVILPLALAAVRQGEQVKVAQLLIPPGVDMSSDIHHS